MAERPKKLPRDPVQLAKLIGDIATGEIDDREQDSRNPAAVELGRMGGQKRRGGRAAYRKNVVSKLQGPKTLVKVTA
jgi:hypothetical protein